EARAADLQVVNRLAGDQYVAASHCVEEVRRQVQEQYGEQALYSGGLSIRTTIDTGLQLAAARSLRTGLEAYDRRHDWRGPIARGDAAGDVQAQLAAANRPPALSNWVRAMVTRVANGAITLTDENGETGRLNDSDAQWAAQGARRESARRRRGRWAGAARRRQSAALALQLGARDGHPRGERRDQADGRERRGRTRQRRRRAMGRPGRAARGGAAPQRGRDRLRRSRVE